MSSRFKRKGGEKFLAIFRHTYRTDAWRALKPADRVLYLVLLMRYDGFNNGRITLSQRDAATDMNVANRKTVAASFRALEEHGFIKTVVPSGFNRKDRVAGVFSLREHRDDRKGEPPAKTYMEWRPGGKTTGDETDIGGDETLPAPQKKSQNPSHLATNRYQFRPNCPDQVATISDTIYIYNLDARTLYPDDGGATPTAPDSEPEPDHTDAIRQRHRERNRHLLADILARIDAVKGISTEQRVALHDFACGFAAACPDSAGVDMDGWREWQWQAALKLAIETDVEFAVGFATAGRLRPSRKATAPRLNVRVMGMRRKDDTRSPDPAAKPTGLSYWQRRRQLQSKVLADVLLAKQLDDAAKRH